MLTYITGAHAVLADEVITDASLLIKDGLIDAINPTSTASARVVDLQGAYLLPGFVDLHCDAIERDFEPRANVFFPAAFAVAMADQRNTLAGITTIFQSVAFDNKQGGVRSIHRVEALVRAITEARGKTRIEHRVHARYEIPDDKSEATVMQLMQEGALHMLSLMDHTPGQGRNKVAATNNAPIRLGGYASTDGHLSPIHSSGAHARLTRLAGATVQHAIPLASHDDDTAAQVMLFGQLGATICEFPLNLETAHAARQLGMKTIVGAPNLVRGKSQSGAMRAIDAVHANAADILCSDYLSQSLLPAVMSLPAHSDLTLPQAVAMATKNPAHAVGLTDRGEIAVGKRADLIGVGAVDGFATLCAVWSAGKMVLHAPQA